MPTLRQRANEATEDDLLKRVQQGLLQAAGEVIAEDPETVDHVKRRNLAQLVITNPNSLASAMAHRVASHENFGSDPSPTGNDPANDTDSGDGALMYLIRQYWNDYAENMG